MPAEPGQLAAALLITGAGIAWWQRRATSCSRHRAWAGRVAWLLAGLCLAGAIGLLALPR